MKSKLPIVESCVGCGACCFHMGYPAFNVPESELIRGSSVDISIADPGSVEYLDRLRWNSLPDDLREDLQQVIKNYSAPTTGVLDGSCVWLDPETRLCRNHLHRPQVCRDFEIGCKKCHEWRVVYRDQIIQD